MYNYEYTINYHILRKPHYKQKIIFSKIFIKNIAFVMKTLYICDDLG